MPLTNGRIASAKPGRSKSTSSAIGKLPPVISQESRDRAETLKKAYDRPKTANRNSRPPTSAYALPSFGNGRLPTATKNMRLAIKRSNSETRALPKIEYGRSESREKLADLKDELFQTKKKVAGYETDFKRLSTEMQRLRRDAEKRETFLERIVTAQYHPTELNDTNLARTLTSIKKKEIAKENLIDIQHKELERLRNLLKDKEYAISPAQVVKGPESTASADESDYPEEPDQMIKSAKTEKFKQETKKSSVSTANDSVLNTDDEVDEVFEKPTVPNNADKSKERNALAKKYAEQNAMLKQRLKEVKHNYVSMLEKNKKKGEEFVKQNENSKAVVEKTVEISTVLETLQKEREDLTEVKKQNEFKIEDLSNELREAYGEIDALKMHNEKLQESLMELELRVGHIQIESDPESILPITIPRLDMTDIDHSTLHDNTERSNMSSFSEFDHEHLADALAEIAGAHCERLKMITQ